MNDELFNIIETLDLLNDNEICYIKNNKDFKLFKKIKDSIKIFDNGSSYYLSIDDFKELYKDSKFNKFDKDLLEESVDYKKDEEYYSFTHK